MFGLKSLFGRSKKDNATAEAPPSTSSPDQGFGPRISNSALQQQLPTVSPTGSESGIDDPWAGAVLEQASAEQSEPTRVDLANAAFSESIQEGKTNLGALVDATIASPGGVGYMFLEAFAESDLEPLTAPLHLGSTAAGMVPHKGAQLGGDVLGHMANGTDLAVGAITGNTEKSACALAGIGTDLALGAVGGDAKTTDHRINPWYFNAKGEISDAGQEALVNNTILTGSGEAVGGVTGCGTSVDNAKTTWDSLTGISTLWDRPGLDSP
jgi:hypothetical protein